MPLESSPPSSASGLPHRRRPQFSIRSLLALMAVVSLVFSLWVLPALKQREVLTALRGHYTDVTYQVAWQPTAYVPQRVVDLVGIDFFRNITGLEIYNPTDEVLARLKGLPRLRSLVLHGTDFTTDDGLAQIGKLNQLRALGMPHSKLNNDRLKNLRGLQHLQQLDVQDTSITDQGLLMLADLPELRELRLSSTAVTENGIAELKRRAPRCVITRD